METFSKSERLCSLKIIEELFESGKIIISPLFKVIWLKSPVPLSYPAQIAISVPRKKFRRAVDRNLIRRRIKEAYRRNKQALYTELTLLGLQVVFILIYRGNGIPDYFTVEKSIREVTGLLLLQIRKKLKLY